MALSPVATPNNPTGTNLVMISVSGTDRPGITAGVCKELTKHNVEILDINQHIVHNRLFLGMVIQVHDDTNLAIKDILYAGHNLGMKCKVEYIEKAHYEDWVKNASQSEWIVTILGREIKAESIGAITDRICDYSLNIFNITRLSGRKSVSTGETSDKACLELRLKGEVEDEQKFRKDLLQLSSTLSVDISLQANDLYRRYRRLACFDMDSTLIQCEVIDELAKLAGVGEKVIAVTERAMRGELDFKQSLYERVACLEGLSESVLQEVAARLPLTEGCRTAIRLLRKMGYKTAIFSGGFTYFAQHLQKELGFDFVHANTLEIKDGKLTGKVIGEVVDAQRKADLLEKYANEQGLDLRQVVAVGDGANDLPMLAKAGLGVAYHAKPIVRAQAKNQISTVGLDGVLYLVGVSDRDIKREMEM